MMILNDDEIFALRPDYKKSLEWSNSVGLKNPDFRAKPESYYFDVAKAQLKKVTDELDIEFILCLLEQNENILWSKKGRHSCKEQIKKLKALVKEASC